MPIPFPSPSSLRTAVLNLQSALSTFERARSDERFSASSADSTVSAQVDGMMRVVSITIAPSQLAIGASALATKVKDVVNTAIAAAETATRTRVQSFASTLSLPGLPPYGSAPPDYPNFAAMASQLEADILANNPCNSTRTFQCRSGNVVAVVNARRRVLSLTFEEPLPSLAAHLATRAREAINCADEEATDRPDDTTDVIDKITGGSATFQNLVLYASNFLNVEHEVTVRDQAGTGFGMIGNAGTFLTDVDFQSEVGNILSRAKVSLGNDAHVHGFIRTASTVIGEDDATVTGPIIENANVVLPNLALNVAFPATNKGQFIVRAGNQATITPGYYTRIEIELNATLFMGSGLYFCQTFDLDPGGKVVFNTAQGPVFLYVRDVFDYDGTFVDSAGGFPNVFVGYVGTLTLFLNKPFSGTLAAPKAKIDLETVSSPGHAGAFHAKDIEVDSHQTIRHRPFPVAYENLPGLVPP